jgi:hypothetical protein
MAKGKKTGGRSRGTPNKRTVEQAIVAERIVNEAQMAGKKLAKEQLGEFMELFAGLAASFQPPSTEKSAIEAWSATSQEPLFEKYAKLSCVCAEKLAEFQSPKYGRVQTVAPPPPPKAVHKRFSLSIFENGARVIPASHQLSAPPASKAKH